MSYVVLARKWRPMRFEDLVGQDHVARTLSNAIAAGRVAHAFLFTGVRGVGKTTSARILAKTLNCMRAPGSAEAESDTDPGPTATPCLQCSACKQIANGTDVDVREIDGASYNGVDEVRRLQDSLPYQPSRDRYKIIIVDEVHMLSASAWNAFLKTLEEPPPHVKFIFATTEVHKVPVTILSRVQRFDFKMISARQIADRLRWVLEQEGIQADEQSLSILAREAAGSMRDGMSLLDQVIAWGGESLKGEDVARVLGVASRQILHDLTQAVVQGDAGHCLELVAQIANEGHDISHVAKDLLALLRDLVAAKVCPNPEPVLELPAEEQQDIIQLSKQAESDDLVRLHQGFAQGFDDVVRSGQPRAALEMLLVRLARRPPLLPINDLVARLATLERRLASGGTPRTTSRSGPAPTSASRPAVPQTRSREARSSASPPSSEPAEEPPRAASEPLPQRSPPTASSEDTRPPRPTPPTPSPSSGNEAPRAEPPSSTTEAPASGVLDPWRAIVDRIQASRPELAAFLGHAHPIEVQPGRVRIGWASDSVFADQATDKASLEMLTQVASEHFGCPTQVGSETLQSSEALGSTLSDMDRQARDERTRAAIAKAKSHPRLNDALEIFGAKIKDLKLAE